MYFLYVFGQRREYHAPCNIPALRGIDLLSSFGSFLNATGRPHPSKLVLRRAPDVICSPVFVCHGRQLSDVSYEALVCTRLYLRIRMLLLVNGEAVHPQMFRLFGSYDVRVFFVSKLGGAVCPIQQSQQCRSQTVLAPRVAGHPGCTRNVKPKRSRWQCGGKLSR